MVFSAADGDLYLLNFTTNQVERLTDTTDEESTPTFSPDGHHVIYAAGPPRESQRIFTLSLRTRHRIQVTSGGSDTRDVYPRYSADGSVIAFSRSHRHRGYSMGGMTRDDWDVYVMTAGTTAIRRLTEQKSRGANRVAFADGDIFTRLAPPTGIS